MKEQDKTQVLVTLQNGIGFTAACNLVMLDPKAVSDYIRKVPEYHQRCIRAVKSSVQANLNYSQKLKNEQNWAEWQRQQKRLKDFISDLVLWESHAKRKEVTPETVVIAVALYKTVDECATALGFTKREFLEYCISQEGLTDYLQQNHVYQF